MPDWLSLFFIMGFSSSRRPTPKIFNRLDLRGFGTRWRQTLRTENKRRACCWCWSRRAADPATGSTGSRRPGYQWKPDGIFEHQFDPKARLEGGATISYHLFYGAHWLFCLGWHYGWLFSKILSILPSLMVTHNSNPSSPTLPLAYKVWSAYAYTGKYFDNFCCAVDAGCAN